MSDALRWTVDCADALDWLRARPTDSADLCVTSPPYTAARTYGIKAQRGPAEWVAWLRPIIVEACRVARLVALNVSDQVKDFRYGCGDLWLVADLTRLDGLALGPAPYAWHRPGVSGSGGPHYHRRNWEPVYLLARPENLPPKWSDNTAFGKPPKYGPGGEMSHRLSDGTRVNQWGGKAATRERRKGGTRNGPDRPGHQYVRGKMLTRAEDIGPTSKVAAFLDADPSSLPPGAKIHSKRDPDGTLRTQAYIPPVLANPGNVIRTGNGGGQLGHELAHENEAPMNLALAERFVCWFCPPGGTVIDPFTGSGTTGHAAKAHGRAFAGCDVRQSQVELALRRLQTVTVGLFV